MGASVPNNLYMVAAQSGSIRNNDWPKKGTLEFRPVTDELDQAHVSWRCYRCDYFELFRSFDKRNARKRPQVLSDIQSGDVPNVLWIYPSDENSEHSPYDVAEGEQWVTSVVSAIMDSSQWYSSDIFLVWDD
jgi:hypothetical protein